MCNPESGERLETGKCYAVWFEGCSVVIHCEDAQALEMEAREHMRRHRVCGSFSIVPAWAMPFVRGGVVIKETNSTDVQVHDRELQAARAWCSRLPINIRQGIEESLGDVDKLWQCLDMKGRAHLVWLLLEAIRPGALDVA
jgi:hypothetical protein